MLSKSTLEEVQAASEWRRKMEREDERIASAVGFILRNQELALQMKRVMQRSVDLSAEEKQFLKASLEMLTHEWKRDVAS